MRTIKALLFSFALIAGLEYAYAQENLTVILKDGTELTGFISRQRPGEDFTFSTSKALVMLPSKDVKSIIENSIKYSALTQEWKAWADENNAYEGTEKNKYLTLCDIIKENGVINRVRILEKGAKVRYLELTPNSYSLSMDTIEVIKVEKRPKLLLSGVNRRYKLASGMEYEGQYIEEVPGETMSLLRDNGIIEVFNTEEVLKDNRYKINPNQSLIEQSDLLDIVQMNNGISYKGVIFERNYSETDEITNDYLLIQLENETIMSLNLADVIEYRKEKNPKYKPLTDIELNNDEAALNRTICKLVPTKEVGGIVTVDSDTLKINLSLETGTDICAEFSLENSKAQHLKLIRIRKFKNKRGKLNYYGFTYEDIVKKSRIPNFVETSVNGISKAEFKLPDESTGLFGIYNPLTDKIIIFEIKA